MSPQIGAGGAPRSRSKRSLTIVERAYRGSIEEQYGHILWLSRIMKGMGAPTALLLKGDTVNFARRGQPALHLQIGDLAVTGLSHHESGVEALLTAGVPVYFWQADAERLNLPAASLVKGVQAVRADEMPALINQFDCIWYW